MGLIQAAKGAIGGMLADQWKDFLTVPAGLPGTAAVFAAVGNGDAAIALGARQPELVGPAVAAHTQHHGRGATEIEGLPHRAHRREAAVVGQRQLTAELQAPVRHRRPALRATAHHAVVDGDPAGLGGIAVELYDRAHGWLRG